jgi:predicted HTH domain antitoxin
MSMRTIEVPEEILQLFESSLLSGRADAEPVKTALAIHLFQEGLISMGRAAELAGVPRYDFEWLLVQMGLPTVRYDVSDYERDLGGLEQAEHPRSPS